MANELSALVELAATAADRVALRPAQSLHAAISGRVFRAIGPAAAPARVVHDGLAGASYTGVRAALSRGSKAVATATRRSAGDREVLALSRSRRGRVAVGAINAVIGDELARTGSDLAIRMAVRRRGRDVALTPEGLGAAFPEPRAKLAVFLHGLAETEEWWSRGRFGAQLRDDLGYTAVLVRFNTGLHVSQNGAELAELLELLAERWPVRVRELALVGHSMGGLVARSACLSAQRRGQRWTALVSHLVTLGTPHTGAPLEKAVHVLAWAMRQVPEASPFAEILDTRSAGIRDLRFGYVDESEWAAEDPGRLLDDRRSLAPLLPGCTHTFITASLAREPRHPLSVVAGDLLVRTDSAAGRHRRKRVEIAEDRIIHLGGLTHFDLLSHPRVYAEVRRALAAPGSEARATRSARKPLAPAP